MKILLKEAIDIIKPLQKVLGINVDNNKNVYIESDDIFVIRIDNDENPSMDNVFVVDKYTGEILNYEIAIKDTLSKIYVN